MAFAGNVDELALLQSVRLKGAVTPPVLALQLGVAESSALAALTALVEMGRAVADEGGSVSLTAAGIAELDDQLDAERVSIDEFLFAEDTMAAYVGAIRASNHQHPDHDTKVWPEV